MESSYIGNSKYVFRKIRIDRDQIIRYFHKIKVDFKKYLRRPDSKQEYVDSFVKEYNNIADDLRDDEEVRNELHQRVDDLNETLWNICDKKKVESEKEREQIMNNGWVPDKIGLISNHYITLMQSELDRFQDTSKFMRDYYKVMINPMPDETNPDYPRLPLLDLKNSEENQSNLNDQLSNQSDSNLVDQTDAAVVSSSNNSDGKKTPPNRSKSPKSASKGGRKSKSPPANKKPTTPPAQSTKGKGKKGSEMEKIDDNGKRFKIPLIPRTSLAFENKDNKKSKSKVSKNISDEPSPLPPDDLDERLLFDAFKTSCNHVNTIIGLETIAMEEPKQPDVNEPPPAAAGKGKKGKSASPSGKGKGKESPKGKSKSPKGGKGKKGAKETDTEAKVPVQELSEEEKHKKMLREHIRKEYLAALKKEENSFKIRIELIKQIAIKIIQNLKLKADNSYKDMNDYLGNSFLKEMDSIKHLSSYIKHCIENRLKIKQELILQQDEFIIDADVIVMRTPSPPPRPHPVEPISSEYFTIDSLRIMLRQFRLVAPEGLIAIKSFIDLYNDLVMLNYSNEILPDQWAQLTTAQIETLAKMLASGSEFVDWKHWLFTASYLNSPFPTQTQLLKLFADYKRMDYDTTGYIDKSAFIQTPLWFRIPKPDTPDDIKQPHSFDRHHHLIEFWFDLFATGLPNLDYQQKVIIEKKLDYKNMLFYMSIQPDAYEGFLKALSISQEAPMPRLTKKVQMKSLNISKFETLFKELGKSAGMKELYPSDQLVSIDSLYNVFHHGERRHGDTHRFATSEDPEDFMSIQRIKDIFTEINDDTPTSTIPYSKLIQHPIICEMISICTKYKAPVSLNFVVVFFVQFQKVSDLV
jgi:hypothetical protein